MPTNRLMYETKVTVYTFFDNFGWILDGSSMQES